MIIGDRLKTLREAKNLSSRASLPARDDGLAGEVVLLQSAHCKHGCRRDCLRLGQSVFLA